MTQQIISAARRKPRLAPPAEFSCHESFACKLRRNFASGGAGWSLPRSAFCCSASAWWLRPSSPAVFGLLLFSSAERLASFGAAATAYITFVHGVLGAVMFGWGVALLSVLLGPLRHRSKQAWSTFVTSLSAWFVPGTALTLWSGFWQNAMLNLVLAVVFAIPLVATHDAFNENRA